MGQDGRARGLGWGRLDAAYIPDLDCDEAVRLDPGTGLGCATCGAPAAYACFGLPTCQTCYQAGVDAVSDEWARALDAWSPPLRGRRPPPAHRRPKRGSRDRAPASPAPLVLGEIRGYFDIPPKVRRLAGHPKSRDPDYRRVVTAAFVAWLSPGQRRARGPTAPAVQGLLDGWDGAPAGVAKTGDGNRLHQWLARFSKRPGEPAVSFEGMLEDARRLRDAWESTGGLGLVTTSHGRVTK